ncbi:hypothetical protein FQZ97_798840 [compost metagenome]
MKRAGLMVLMIATFASCTNKKIEEVAKQKALTELRDSLKLDSFKKAEIARKDKELEEKHQAEIAAQQSRTYTSGGVSNGSYSGAAATVKKKGWSDAAKGAAIGAGVGALGGILIDKKDGRGAIIGGLAGAGAGYAIGRSKDVKSGRVQPKN